MSSSNKQSEEESVRGLLPSYYSEKNDLSKEFFVPCLKTFVKYDRAAGYFSSSALRSWAGAITRIAAVDHLRVRLLISPVLPEADLEVLRTTLDFEQRRQVLRNQLDTFLDRAILWEDGEEPTDADLADILAWLIATGRLEIRFAFNIAEDRQLGIFHKKIGIFEFPWGDQLAFTGSANESWMGHTVNSESIDVFRSWVSGDNERLQLKVEEFDACWKPDPAKLLVEGISEATLQKIKIYSESHPITSRSPKVDAIFEPDPLLELKDLWEHQKRAFAAFRDAESGILEMATGTGKTRTALAIVRSFLREKRIDSVVITMAGNDLLSQWEDDIQITLVDDFRLTLFRSFGAIREEERFMLSPRGSVLLCSRGNLQKIVRRMRKVKGLPRMAIIHDEVHDLGSPGNRESLIGHRELFAFRLGLSATPDRDYDDAGNQFIDSEIGKVVYRYALEDAINDGVLCPFDYYPLPYSLTSEDRADLKAVYAAKNAADKNGNPWSDEKLWIELSRVRKKARMKPSMFEQFLGLNGSLGILSFTVIFVEDKEFGERLYEILIRHTHRYSQYFDSDEPSVLKRFAEGDLDCLVTCHKLSQGIDIQRLQNVVLFSSQRGRRETIQRLGRCLRKDGSNPAKVARVVDFFECDDNGQPVSEGFDTERVAWLSELAKVRPAIVST